MCVSMTVIAHKRARVRVHVARVCVHVYRHAYLCIHACAYMGIYLYKYVRNRICVLVHLCMCSHKCA